MTLCNGIGARCVGRLSDSYRIDARSHRVVTKGRRRIAGSIGIAAQCRRRNAGCAGIFTDRRCINCVGEGEVTLRNRIVGGCRSRGAEGNSVTAGSYRVIPKGCSRSAGSIGITTQCNSGDRKSVV